MERRRRTREIELDRGFEVEKECEVPRRFREEDAVVKEEERAEHKLGITSHVGGPISINGTRHNGVPFLRLVITESISLTPRLI